MASFILEEESSLEEPMEFNSIRSSIVQAITSDPIGKIAITFDTEDFRIKLTSMLTSVNISIEHIDDVIMCCKTSYFAGQLDPDFLPITQVTDPKLARDELIGIRIEIKEGISYLEQLYKCSNEIFNTIGYLVMFDIELPELEQFDLPHTSLLEAFSKIISETDIKCIVGTLTSKQCLNGIINLATKNIMSIRRYRQSLTRIFEECSNEVISHQLSSEITSMKCSMRDCFEKIADFERKLEINQVRAKLKSANTMLEIAISNNKHNGVVTIRTILHAFEQFQISFKSFSNEEPNIGKSRDELWLDVQNHPLSTGLIYPIEKSLKCTQGLAWKILKLLDSRYSMYKNKSSYIDPMSSLTSDPGLD